MSPQTEHSEEPSTLPPPELNPLLNPLLAENMGRWAQVYFTSPPEKREQAVQELLRELEAENSMRAKTGVAAPSSDTSSSAAPSSFASSSVAESASEPAIPHASQVSEVQPTLVRCHACGRKNPSSQRFCGLCGTRLGEEAASRLQSPNLHREDRYDRRCSNRREFNDPVSMMLREPTHLMNRDSNCESNCRCFKAVDDVEYYNDE